MRDGCLFRTGPPLPPAGASWHYAADRDLTALMKLGGWKRKMVLRYARVNVTHLAQSIAALPWRKSEEVEGEAKKSLKPSIL